MLLYVTSIFPITLFHQHQRNIVAYEAADDCDKTIYYNVYNTDCGHKNHISTTLEKCSICDHHSTVLYTNQFFNFSFTKLKININYIDFYSVLLARFTPLYFNKGPPLV
jgi:hypothetical protein